MTPELEAKIRAEFNAWYPKHELDKEPGEFEFLIYKKAYLAGWAGALEQLEPYAEVDADDDNCWANILPDRDVVIATTLYRLPPEIEKEKK